MIKHVLSFLRRGSDSRKPSASRDQESYADDLLSHPEIRAMSRRELADLPFPRG
jgi:hypothetical protein